MQVGLGHFRSSAAAKHRCLAPGTCSLGEDPREEKALGFGFSQGKHKSFPEGTGPAKFGAHFEGCLGPSVCHLTRPAVPNLAEAAITKQSKQTFSPWPQVDQMADDRPPTTPAPAVGRAPAEGRRPRCTRRWPRRACLSPASQGSRAPVPGTHSCQQRLEDRDAVFGDLSTLLVGMVAAARLPQIVIYKLLAACRPFANKPSQRGIKRSPK